MPDTPWSNLEEMIASGKVQGEWPAARDDWGAALPATHAAYHSMRAPMSKPTLFRRLVFGGLEPPPHPAGSLSALSDYV